MMLFSHFVKMARLSLFVLGLLVAIGLCDPIQKVVPPETVEFLNKQLDHMFLYYHAREPNHITKCKSISSSWVLANNIDNFKNTTAVNIWLKLNEHKWLLPRSVPFSILNSKHQFEAATLFNVLYSAKTYDIFYKAAVYAKDRVNQYLFVYVLNAVHMHRSDMEGFSVPPLYEVSPEFFNNGEILTIAQEFSVQGDRVLIYNPRSTYKWDNDYVIRWNETAWPYHSSISPITYFINDYGLNSYYFYYHLTHPNWLGGEVVPLISNRRGEWMWFLHKQIVTRYYMERLSNGLGEISDLEDHVVEEGYSSGYLYDNGIPYPVRPDHLHLDQHKYLGELQKIEDYERRIRDAIQSGFIIDSDGKVIDIRAPDAIDILGRIIEGGVDSPNTHYYKDFISSWKMLLGNSWWRKYYQHNAITPLVVPSALEHYQTALSDPAFYMIWKRVLNLFTLWHSTLPLYTKDELTLPSVTIEKVDVDKLVTYLEYTYMNISTFLHMDVDESTYDYDKESVLVQYPRLNHKQFMVRVNVKSEVAKKVLVKFFLAPKYNSQGVEIPLNINYENFFMLDYFTHDLPAGESVIVRDSTKNTYTVDDLKTAYSVYQKTLNTLEGKGEYDKSQWQRVDYFPRRLLLPKGRVGGMEFHFLVYISEVHDPKAPLATASDGFTSDSVRVSGETMGFPLDRPLHLWQIKDVRNIYFQDVLIHHKPTPEIACPYTH